MDATADGKPCRSCTDFKSWAKLQKQTFDSEKKSEKGKTESDVKYTEVVNARRNDCPLDKDELGSGTWGFLHTMAASYPESPTAQDKKDMKTFFHLLSRFYPCHICADDLKEQLKKSPPKTDSRNQLSQWLCDIHNEINIKIGKPKFNCDLVYQRWRDGWIDGSCD